MVQRMHDVGLLVAGAEGYRTQWAAGIPMGAPAPAPNKHTAAFTTILEG